VAALPAVEEGRLAAGPDRHRRVAEFRQDRRELGERGPGERAYSPPSA
jgi:hypothetical protein